MTAAPACTLLASGLDVEGLYDLVLDVPALSSDLNHTKRMSIVSVLGAGSSGYLVEGSFAVSTTRSFGENCVNLLSPFLPPGDWTIAIRRLLPGQVVPRHTDGAHVKHRYFLVIHGQAGCQFFAGTETIEHCTGDLWLIRGLAFLEHGAVNESPEDRIIAMIDVAQGPSGAARA